MLPTIRLFNRAGSAGVRLADGTLFGPGELRDIPADEALALSHGHANIITPDGGRLVRTHTGIAVRMPSRSTWGPDIVSLPAPDNPPQSRA